MLVKNQKIILKVYSYKLLEYYKSKGYNCNLREDFEVDIKDLINSSVTVEVECDYCHKHYYMTLERYNRDVLKSPIPKCACKECKGKKGKEVCLKLYGVPSTALIPEIREKQKLTTMERYGCYYPTQNPDIIKKRQKNNLAKYGVKETATLASTKEKIKKTSKEKYGVDCWLTLPEYKEKREKGTIEKYGYINPFFSAEVQEKIKQTNLKKYGVKSILQLDYIKEKSRLARSEMGKIPSSKTQRRLAKIYDGELNYCIDGYYADIFIKPNIIVEYNGGGHNLTVKFGFFTETEFKNREKFRKECLIKKGYKIITLINTKDKFYSDELYLKILNIGFERINKTNIEWIDIDLNMQTIITEFEEQQLNLI